MKGPFKDFDELESSVESGYTLTKQKSLRDLIGSQRSGTNVNKKISFELHRRGIVHLPKELPRDQRIIVILAKRGSQEERGLGKFVDLIKEYRLS